MELPDTIDGPMQINLRRVHPAIGPDFLFNRSWRLDLDFDNSKALTLTL